MVLQHVLRQVRDAAARAEGEVVRRRERRAAIEGDASEAGVMLAVGARRKLGDREGEGLGDGGGGRHPGNADPGRMQAAPR